MKHATTASSIRDFKEHAPAAHRRAALTAAIEQLNTLYTLHGPNRDMFTCNMVRKGLESLGYNGHDAYRLSEICMSPLVPRNIHLSTWMVKFEIKFGRQLTYYFRVAMLKTLRAGKSVQKFREIIELSWGWNEVKPTLWQVQAVIDTAKDL